MLGTVKIFESEDESHGIGCTEGSELLLCSAVLLGAVHSGKKPKHCSDKVISREGLPG